jgi:hypothetical protein
MTITTSGDDQNSYITLSEANALLLTMKASFMDLGEQLEEGDEAYLIESANDLEALWRWSGHPTENTQAMAWPRKFVRKPGWVQPCEPGWRTPYDAAEWMQYKVDYLSGSNVAAQFLPDDEVPRGIKEAQALIALLRKKDGNLIGDDQGDAQGTQLGPMRISYVNAVRESADIHKRTGQLGLFIGDGLMRTPNA